MFLFYVYRCLSYMCVCAQVCSTYGAQKRVMECLELSCKWLLAASWELGTETRSPAKVINTPNH